MRVVYGIYRLTRLYCNPCCPFTPRSECPPSQDEIIYPFQLDSVVQCQMCWTCFHQACYSGTCPKCARIRSRRTVSDERVWDEGGIELKGAPVTQGAEVSCDLKFAKFWFRDCYVTGIRGVLNFINSRCSLSQMSEPNENKNPEVNANNENERWKQLCHFDCDDNRMEVCRQLTLQSSLRFGPHQKLLISIFQLFYW